MPFLITKPLEEQKVEFKTTINTITGEKILAKYPDYVQRNMTARYVELLSLTELDTPEALALKASWDWIKDIRSRSNIANLGIDNASNFVEVRNILTNYTIEITNL